MTSIISRKFDGSRSRSWTAELLERSSDLLTFRGTFDADVEHADLGLIRRGTVSYEFYWLGRWYNIFRFEEPGGALRNFYCNVSMPPVYENDTLEYVDLDIDILVLPDLSYSILDRDEFSLNIERFRYSDEVIANAKKACNDLTDMIRSRSFPFDSAS